MSKNNVTCRDFKRRDGWVFVTPTSVPNSVKIQQKAKDWTGVAKDIVNDTPVAQPTSKPQTPVVKEHNPREILRGIQRRQAEANAEGMRKVKSGRKRADLKALLSEVDAKLGVRS